MKKGIIYKVSLFMLACLSFGACSENDVVDYEAGGLQPLVISATPVETRTLLADDGKSIVWQSDDEIAVYDFVAPKHKFTLESSDRSKARFLGKITHKKDNFLALYPYSLGAENLTVDVTIVGKRYIVEDDAIINDIEAVANSGYINNAGIQKLTVDVGSVSTRPQYEIVSYTVNEVEVLFDYYVENQVPVVPEISVDGSIAADGYFADAKSFFSHSSSAPGNIGRSESAALL